MLLVNRRQTFVVFALMLDLLDSPRAWQRRNGRELRHNAYAEVVTISGGQSNAARWRHQTDM